MTRILLWFRNDLRLHDNQILAFAANFGKKGGKSANNTKEVIPIYCFDPRYFNKSESQTAYDTRKTGIVRAKFQI